MTLDEFFAGRAEARVLFEVVCALVDELGPAEVAVSKSQVAFKRGRNVVVVWTPDRALGPGRVAPLVLTVSLRRRETSPRWKEIVPVGSGRFTHHLELWSAGDLDDEVRGWLAEAWALAEVAG